MQLIECGFSKIGQSRPLFVYFRLFPITEFDKLSKAIDGVLGTQTRGGRKGADESTEGKIIFNDNCIRNGGGDELLKVCTSMQ